jgi:hypothetical protein
VEFSKRKDKFIELKGLKVFVARTSEIIIIIIIILARRHFNLCDQDDTRAEISLSRVE